MRDRLDVDSTGCEQSEAFVRSNPLPPEEVLVAARAAHLAYLDDLDAKYGPPGEEAVCAAKEIFQEIISEP